jgi:hypothetical protein
VRVAKLLTRCIAIGKQCQQRAKARWNWYKKVLGRFGDNAYFSQPDTRFLTGPTIVASMSPPAGAEKEAFYFLSLVCEEK